MSDNFRIPQESEKKPTDIETLLREFLQTKFDDELKQELQKDLKEEYGIAKENQKMAMKRRKFFYLVAAVAASFGLLLVAVNFFNPNSSLLASADPPPWPPSGYGNAGALALNYLETTEIQHGGALKGRSDNTETIRAQAVNAFNAKKYEEAEEYFHLIEDKTEEDLFYTGVAALYNENYAVSVSTLKQVAAQGLQYQTEADWYLALAYILDGSNEDAKVHLEKVESSNWNADAAQQLLKKLE